MKDPFTFPSNSGKKLDSFKTDIECKKRLLPLYEDPGDAFYWKWVTWICTLMAFFSLVFVAHFSLVMIKGLVQRSLENLKISHRNARARPLMSSIYQSYCGHCTLMCMNLCLENLKHTHKPSFPDTHWFQPITQTTPCRSHVWGSTPAFLRLSMLLLSCSC